MPVHINDDIFTLVVEGRLLELQQAVETSPALILSKTDRGDTLLHTAAGAGQIEIIQWLLTQTGIHTEETNDYLETALLIAVYEGQLSTVQWLLEDGGSNINQTNHEGLSVLHLAIQGCQDHIVHWMLTNQLITDIDCQDDQGLTPLLTACFYDNREIVERLLQFGADHTATTHAKQNAIHLAAANCFFDIVEIFVKQGTSHLETDHAGDTPVHLAAETGSTHIVERLLGIGADASAKNLCGETPLHLAAAGGHDDTVEALITGGGKITEVDKDGTPPLIAATSNFRLSTTKLITEQPTMTYRHLRYVLSEFPDIEAGIKAIIEDKSQDYEEVIKKAETDLKGCFYQVERNRIVVVDGLFCPISMELIHDPVTAADGHLYDREAITKWFNQGRDTSPITNARLESRALFPCQYVKRQIDEIIDKVDTVYRERRLQQRADAVIPSSKNTRQRSQSEPPPEHLGFFSANLEDHTAEPHNKEITQQTKRVKPGSK